MNKMLLCCCLAALFASCEEMPLGGVETVTGDPVYNSGILYGTPIESAADLKKIGNDPDWPLDGEYYLAADIDLAAAPDSGEPEDPAEEPAETAWTPIGPDVDAAFTGMFNGNGKTISGLKLSAGGEGGNIYTGLFGYLNRARVWNLTVELANSKDESITLSSNSAQYIGVLAGYAVYTIIFDVTIQAAEYGGLYSAKSGGNKCYAGGLVAYLQYDNFIKNVSVDLPLKSDISINTDQYSGLISGQAEDGTSVILCTAKGSVEVEKTGTGAGAIYAGGLIGYGNTGSKTTPEKCESRVTKVIAKTAGTGIAYAGGITGYESGFSTPSFCILSTGAEIEAVSTNTASTGNIGAGGIIGYMGPSLPSYNSVRGAARITAKGAGKQSVYAGGITGFGNNGGEVSYSFVTSGVTVLAASANDQNGNYAVNAGGIAGYIKVISNCYSLAGVAVDTALKTANTTTNRTAAGGLAGMVATGGQVLSSYSTGSIEITSAHAENIVHAGGLVGAINAANMVTVKDSAALNGSIKVQSGTEAVYANRVIGAAYNGTTLQIPGNDGATIEFSNLYASSGMTVQKRINSGDWTDIDQSTNNAGGYTGSSNFIVSQDSFQSELLWDFTGPGGARPPVWNWDGGLGLPVLYEYGN